MLRQDDTGWSNPKVIAILAVVFLCGSVVGATAMRAYFHSKMLTSKQELRYNGQRVSVNRLKAELKLTPEQMQTVEGVLDDFAKFYQNIEEQRADIAENGMDRIARVLDDEQRAKFNQMLRRPEHTHR